MSEAKRPPRWARPFSIALVALVAIHAAVDGRGQATYRWSALAAAVYLAVDWLLRRRLGDEMAAKRVLQIAAAALISVPTTVALLDPSLRAAPLTAWSGAIEASLAVEIGVTSAALVTAVRAQLAMPLWIAHHALLLLACHYVVRHRFGTLVIVASLFQETTNVGWYLHWVLNSPESAQHARWPRLFNVNALWTIAWYAIGRFGVSTPILLYLLWRTPPGAPWAYVALYSVGLLAQTYMNATNFAKLVQSYPRCASSWLHRPAVSTERDEPLTVERARR